MRVKMFQCVYGKKKTCTKQNVKYVRCMCLKLKGTNKLLFFKKVKSPHLRTLTYKCFDTHELYPRASWNIHYSLS